MHELYSDLGKEYAKMYSRSALQQMLDWANKAETGLNDSSNLNDPKATLRTVKDDDADFYGDFASMLQALLDATK